MIKTGKQILRKDELEVDLDALMRQEGFLFKNYYVQTTFLVFTLVAFVPLILYLISLVNNLFILVLGVPIAVVIGLKLHPRQAAGLSLVYFSAIIIAAQLMFPINQRPGIPISSLMGVLAYTFISCATAKVNMVRLDSIKAKEKYYTLMRNYSLEKEYSEWKNDQIMILRREINHRVRNSIMVIMSLLDDERRRIRNEPIDSKFNRIEGKIDAFYQAHQISAEMGGENHIPIGLYIEQLLKYSFPCEASFEQVFRITLTPEDLHLTLPVVIPLGVIAVESLSPFFFGSQKKDCPGPFEVSFTREGDNVLFVLNNTDGGSTRTVLDNNSSIIHTMAQQLHARWEYENPIWIKGLLVLLETHGMASESGDSLNLEIVSKVAKLPKEKKKEVRDFIDALGGGDK